MGYRRCVGGVVLLAIGCGRTSHSTCPALPNDINKPPRWSTVPDELSAVNDDEIRVQFDGAAVVRRSGEDTGTMGEGFDQTDWMGSANVLGRWASRFVTAYLGGSTAVSTLAETDDRAQLTAMAGIGFRLQSEHGETHWRAVAARIDASYGESVSTKGNAEGTSDPFLTLRPLDAMRFGRGEHIQLITEIRYELMGCYGPFLHLTGGSRLDMPDDEVIFTVPFSLNIGAHRELGVDPIIVFGGLDLDVVEPQDVPEFLPRLRFGIETLSIAGESRIRASFIVEIVLGEVDGAYGGIGLTFPLGTAP